MCFPRNLLEIPVSHVETAGIQVIGTFWPVQVCGVGCCVLCSRGSRVVITGIRTNVVVIVVAVAAVVVVVVSFQMVALLFSSINFGIVVLVCTIIENTWNQAATTAYISSL